MKREKDFITFNYKCLLRLHDTFVGDLWGLLSAGPWCAMKFPDVWNIGHKILINYNSQLSSASHYRKPQPECMNLTPTSNFPGISLALFALQIANQQLKTTETNMLHVFMLMMQQWEDFYIG